MTSDEAKLEILNRALMEVGSPIVESLDDDGTSFQSALSAWGMSLRSLLRKHEWNFSMKRLEISADATPPSFEFGSRFQLPEDFVRLSDIYRFIDFPYRIEDGYILTESSGNLPLVYVYNNQDASSFDDLFRETLAIGIARNISYQVVQSRALREELTGTYERALARARFVDSSERSMRRIEASEWVLARLGRAHPNRFDNIVPPTP